MAEVAAASGTSKQYRVVVVRDMERDDIHEEADLLVFADSPRQAASWVLHTFGGGYVDYVGVSKASGSRDLDQYGFVEDDCFLFCLSVAGKFFYEAWL